MLATGYVNKTIFNLHPNMLITKNTSFDDYFYESKYYLTKRYEDGYFSDVIHMV